MRKISDLRSERSKSQSFAQLRKINFRKEKYQSFYSKLQWQFIVFGHNEHEIEKARNLAKELKMSFKLKFNYSLKKFPIRKAEYIAQEMGASSITEFEVKKSAIVFFCLLSVMVCSANQLGRQTFRLLCQSFWQFWQCLETLLRSEKYVYAKKMLLGKVLARADIPCVQCNRYKRSFRYLFVSSWKYISKHCNFSNFACLTFGIYRKDQINA